MHREREQALGDGSCKTFLRTEGKNDDEVQEELIAFLEYMKQAPRLRRENLERIEGDELLKKLEKRNRELKKNRGLEERYMLLEELLEEERKEGLEEGCKAGQEQMFLVVEAMLADGRTAEVSRFAEPEFREAMFARYQIR